MAKACALLGSTAFSGSSCFLPPGRRIRHPSSHSRTAPLRRRLKVARERLRKGQIRKSVPWISPVQTSVGANALELRTRRLHRYQLGADLVFDFLGNLRTSLQEIASVVLALADALTVVAVPGTGLLDDALGRAHVDDFAFARNAEPVHDFELGLTERRRDLVLDHFDARLVADDFFARLDGADAADIETHRGVELERVATRGGFRVAEHDADLHAD